ncbi:MAG: sodium:solute symporter family protein [Planctomycetia bacterium]
MVTLHPIDAAIIAAFVVVTLAVGFWISGLASKNLRSYFLGGNSIPWYVLGISNASGMFDISGTMLMVYWLFVYGLKSVWIPWLWPVFNQVVMMAYLSVWMRRSGVVTGADWIEHRFGSSRGAQAAHLVVILFALINVVGFLAYGFIGIGKFAAAFLPWQLATDPGTNARVYGLAITALTTLYVVKGGMYSVVFTEVLQFVVMTAGCIGVGVIAMARVSPDQLAAAVPAGWEQIWFGREVGLDWSGLLPAANARIAGDGWRMFSVFFALALVKGMLSSMAGPAPNYDMQRVLSARSPREAALMSGFVNLVLLFPRYMLITGLAVLALVFLQGDLAAMGDKVDFDLILPLTMRQFIPVGLFGLLLAALLAAFMSTYAATVNAAPAYIVNDIYKRYINPHASDRTYVLMSYATTVVVVVVGTAVGFFLEALQDIVNWIVGSLYGGYIAANILKWHWWRFNGWGYFWGMVAGITAALGFTVALNGQMTLFGLEKNLAVFPAILLISLAASVIGSLLTPPDELAVLTRFYRRVRPWGWWAPVHAALVRDQPGAAANRDCARDMFNVAVGIVWQTSLTAGGIYVVTKNFGGLAWALGIAGACMIILKYSWYDRLENYPAGVGEPAER